MPKAKGRSMEGQILLPEDALSNLGWQERGLEPARLSTNRGDLLATLEQQIIPRLVRAYGGERCGGERFPPTKSEIEAFAALVIASDSTAALRFIEDLGREGVTVEDILLRLVGPTARLLGERWLNDELSFAEVTVGASLLQRIVHLFGKHSADEVPQRGTIALVTPAPEQHTLGVHLLGEFFRRGGFSVEIRVNATEASLADLIRSRPFAAVGISVVNDALVPTGARLVQCVRSVAKIDFPVLVGGTSSFAEIANSLGAFYCSDPRAAVAWLSRSVHETPNE